MSRPDAADAAGVLVAVALRLQTLERDMHILLGVDDNLVAAVAALPGARVEDTVYVQDGDEPYVLRTAEARIGRVTLRAIADRRPATATEIESAGNWHEHAEPEYRVGVLRRAL